MKALSIGILFTCLTLKSFCWGFFGHQRINHYAVFLLPPAMMALYKPNISFISEHAIDPDKRRYGIPDEAARHYLDIDYYGSFPFHELPRNWDSAVAKYSLDTIKAHGIVPWHVQVMLHRLTHAFKEKNFSSILKNSAEIGHYIADAHVPLHASSNHNGQKTNQKGIHAFWESRIPELMAEKEFDFFIGKATYIKNPGTYIWDRFIESARASDSVLRFERELTNEFASDRKYSFEARNGVIIRQYAADFTRAFNKKLNGMVERRMRQSIHSIASFWFTAWVNAGQPDLKNLSKNVFTDADIKEFEQLNRSWNAGNILGREEE